MWLAEVIRDPDLSRCGKHKITAEQRVLIGIPRFAFENNPPDVEAHVRQDGARDVGLAQGFPPETVAAAEEDEPRRRIAFGERRETDKPLDVGANACLASGSGHCRLGGPTQDDDPIGPSG